MGAGRLRHSVQLQTLSQATSGTSAVTDTFTTYATVWADAQTRRGLVDIRGVDVVDSPTHLFTIRFRSDVNAEHYLLKGTRRYRITDVRNVDERGRWAELVAEAI